MKIEYDAEFSKYGKCLCCDSYNSINTARLCRDCVNRNNEMRKRYYKKPPLGLKPHYVWLTERIDEIVDAINRYLEARVKVPDEWINEFNELLVEINKKEMKDE